MPMLSSSLVCHSAAKRRNLLFFLGTISLVCATVAHGQSSSCGGLSSTKATTQPIYPAIARAAHIEGAVIYLATFKPDGTVAETRLVIGSPMLQSAASTYINGLRANLYSGPRDCAIVLTFRLVGLVEECGGPNDDLRVDIPSVEQPDAQHYVLTLRNSCVTIMRDPASVIIKRRRLWRF